MTLIIKRKLADILEPSLRIGIDRLLPGSVMPGNLMAGAQQYTADIPFTAIDHDSISWAVGVVALADGRLQKIAAGAMELTGTHHLYSTWGSSILSDGTNLGFPYKFPFLFADASYAVGNNKMLIAVVSKAAVGQKAFIMTPYHDSLILNAAHLSFTAFDTGTNTLDDISNGSTYSRLLSTDISAGHIKLTSSTVKTGNWYDVSGVSIDAASGINIYGTANALTTRATKTGTIQCYVGADGALYAGAGAVLLDVNGIKVTGEFLRFYEGATERGRVAAGASDFNLAAVGAGIPIVVTGANLICDVATAVYPNVTTAVDLGTTTKYWKDVYCVNLIRTNSISQADQTASRVSGTTYQNSTKIRIVTVYVYGSTDYVDVAGYVKSTSPANFVVCEQLSPIITSGSGAGTITFVVPPSYYYRVVSGGTGVTIIRWIESDLD